MTKAALLCPQHLNNGTKIETEISNFKKCVTNHRDDGLMNGPDHQHIGYSRTKTCNVFTVVGDNVQN